MSRKKLVQLELLSSLLFLFIECNLVCRVTLEDSVYFENHVGFGAQEILRLPVASIVSEPIRDEFSHNSLLGIFRTLRAIELLFLTDQLLDVLVVNGHFRSIVLVNENI